MTNCCLEWTWLSHCLSYSSFKLIWWNCEQTVKFTLCYLAYTSNIHFTFISVFGLLREICGFSVAICYTMFTSSLLFSDEQEMCSVFLKLFFTENSCLLRLKYTIKSLEYNFHMILLQYDLLVWLLLICGQSAMSKTIVFFAFMLKIHSSNEIMILFWCLGLFRFMNMLSMNNNMNNYYNNKCL